MIRYVISAVLTEDGPLIIQTHDNHTDFLYACPKGNWTSLQFEAWEKVDYTDFLLTMVHVNREVKNKLRLLRRQ
jgi:hypothetical protein